MERAGPEDTAAPVQRQRSEVAVRPLRVADRAWVHAYLMEHWGSPIQAVNGEILRPEEHEGFVAELDGRPVGLLTMRTDPDGGFEVTILHARVEGRGVGSALLSAAVDAARRGGAPRLWLVTTNDNLRALGFYQRRGMRLRALRPGAVDASRALKPEIPLVAANGIAIRDELELELRLDPGPETAPDARLPQWALRPTASEGSRSPPSAGPGPGDPR